MPIYRTITNEYVRAPVLVEPDGTGKAAGLSPVICGRCRGLFAEPLYASYIVRGPLGSVQPLCTAHYHGVEQELVDVPAVAGMEDDETKVAVWRFRWKNPIDHSGDGGPFEHTDEVVVFTWAGAQLVDAAAVAIEAADADANQWGITEPDCVGKAYATINTGGLKLDHAYSG